MNKIFILKGLVLCVAISVVDWQSIYAEGTLDTTKTGTDKSQFLDATWTLTDGTYAKGEITFNGGINLKGTGLGNTSTSTMNFGCVTPIPYIHLSGQTLRLTSDLYIGSLNHYYSVGAIEGPGFIDMNYHTIHFLNDVQLINDLYLNGVEGYISGNGNNFYIDGRLLLTGYSGVTSIHRFFNTIFLRVSSTNFIAASNYFTYFQDIVFRVNPNSDITLNGGFEFDGKCVIDAPYSRFRMANTFIVGQNATFATTPHTTIRSDGLLYNYDSSSTIVLDTTDVESGNGLYNWNPQSGKVIINGLTTFKTVYPSVYIFGDGSSPANDTEIVINPSSTLIIDAGTTLNYNDVK